MPNAVMRSEHITRCSGLFRPDTEGEAVRFENEDVPGYRGRAECEASLKRRMGCSVIVDKVVRIRAVYTLDYNKFKEIATIEETVVKE